MSSKIEGEHMVCRVRRQKSDSKNNETYFDFNLPYHLFFARGPLTNGVVRSHKSNKFKSMDLIDFSKVSEVKESNTKNILVGAHGKYLKMCFTLKKIVFFIKYYLIK